MDISILTNAPSPIPSHAYAAFSCIILGGIQLYLSKGGARHRWLGRIWVGLMAYVAISSFWIHDINLWNGFSPIHILSLITLYGLVHVIYLARVGNIAGHRRGMKQLYMFALIITGFFTFAPGRTMYQVFFGG